MSFLTRTPALDQHVTIRLDMRAKQISDRVKRETSDTERTTKTWTDPRCAVWRTCLRITHTPEVITAWLEKQDTAFRDQVPRMVFEILKDNTYD